MKHHLMLAAGLLMGLVFFIRGVAAVQAPGVGLQEAYVIGGFLLSGLLVREGVLGWRRARETS